jgi:xanthine dehydrogenase small subunit
MTLASLAESGTTADDEAVRQGLSGNICRCTGYLPLIEAGRTICAAGRRPASQRYTDPAIAADLAHAIREPLRITTDRAEFVVPTTLHVACEYKTNYPDARIAAGGTELGVWRNKRGEEPGRWLSLQRINELNGVVVADGRARFAANATWAEVESFARDHLPVYGPIVRRFASPQIRAVATLAGNVANGSPIADSLGLLAACEAEVELVSIRGRRVVPITGFYHGYKRNDLAADEMIAAVVLPLPGPREHLHVTKVSKRLDMDIASFGSGIRLRLADDTIEQAWIAYTGVAPTVVRLPQTEAFLAGQPFTETTFAEAGRLARSEIDPITDVRGSRDFRLLLAENVLRKCYHELAGEPVGVNGTY